jgi:REP element-mobilizing transposase RayT
MGDSYQIHDQEGCYFLTFQVINWVDIFSRQTYRDIVVDSFNFCSTNKGLQVHAWVIMTNYVHTILSSKTGKLSDTVRDLKRHTATKIIDAIEQEPESRKDWMLFQFNKAATLHKRNKEFQFWTHENHAVYLDPHMPDMFDSRRHYIHQNPVRAGWVRAAEDYVYSSAIDFAGGKGLVHICE